MTRQERKDLKRAAKLINLPATKDTLRHTGARCVSLDKAEKLSKIRWSDLLALEPHEAAEIMSNIRGHRVDPNEASDMLRYAKRRFTNNGLGTHEDTVNDFKAADLGKLAQLGSKTPTTLLYRLISNKTDNLVMG